MNKLSVTLFFVTLLTIASILTACTSVGAKITSQDAGPAANRSASSPLVTGGASGVLKENYTNALPVASQLAIGVFRLDEGESPITPEQAAELIPLWKAYRSLTNSDTASSIEIAALESQIERVLSAEQLGAIAAMKLTRDDLAALFEERQIEPGRPGFGSNATLTVEQQATRQAFRALQSQSGGGEGGFPGGGAPPGGAPGGGIPGGGGPGGDFSPPSGMSPGASGTPMPRQGGAQIGRVNLPLIEALLAFLETRVQ